MKTFRLDYKKALNKPVLIAVLLISALVFIVYFSTLKNGFIADDNYEITGNVFIKSTSYTKDILTKPSWAFEGKVRDVSNYYRPVQYLIYMLIYNTFGPSAHGFHVLKIFLHLAVVLLLFFIIRGYFADYKTALVSALFFAVHPIHTEAVTWISGITDVLVTLFILLCFYCYLYYTKHPDKRYLYASYLMFFIGLFSKETAFVILPLLILYEFLFNDFKLRMRGLYKYLPYIVIFLIYICCRTYAIGNFINREYNKFPGLSAYQCILNPINLFFMYFWKSLVPLWQNAWYAFYPVKSIQEPKMIISLLFFIVFSGVVYLLFKNKRKTELFFFAWFLAALSPILVFFQHIGLNVFAERYLYLPGVAFCFLLSFYLNRIQKRYLSALIAALIICAYMFLAIERNRVWQNDLTFWDATAKASPNYAPIIASLGAAYHNRDMYNEAKKEYEKSLSLDPNCGLGHHGLGLIYLQNGEYDKAAEHFSLAIKSEPARPEFYKNLGATFLKQGKLEEAIWEFKKALELNNYYWEAYLYLSIAYHNNNQEALSIQYFEKALKYGYKIPADFLKRLPGKDNNH